jgi:hypothetical protein
LRATPFDLDRRVVTGDSMLLAPNGISASATVDGRMVYVDQNSSQARTQLTWVDARGTATTTPGVARDYSAIALSPDDTQLAAVVRDRGETSIVLIDPVRGSSVPLVAGSGHGKEALAWSADGQWLLFVELRGFVGTVRAVPVDGRRPPIDVVQGFTPALSPDGRHLVFSRDERGKDSLWVVELKDFQTVGDPRLFRQSAGSVSWPAFSPDGTMLAFNLGIQRGRATSGDIFVTRFPEGTGQWPVSVGGGYFPWWQPSTTGELIYWTRGVGWLAATIRPGATPGAVPTIGAAEKVIDAALMGEAGTISRTGRRAVTLTAADSPDQGGRRLVFVQNWRQVFGARVP